MAIDSAVRWQLIRDVIVHKKTGVLVLQIGANYLNWNIECGKLICVSSTFPEASLTSFVQEKRLTESTNYLTVQNQVDQTKAIGPLLIRHQLLEESELRPLLFEHWTSCADYLLDPTTHLFWSSTPAAIKPEFIRHDRPLGEILVKANKNSITIPTALRIVQQLKGPYRIRSQNFPLDLSGFTEEERRIWMYLQSGTSLKQLFQDRDITKIPCYKFLFLLWLSGSISDSQKNTPPQQIHKVSANLLEKIPPEWVFPLCAGALIGLLLAPASEPTAAPEPPSSRVEPLNETLQKPAWSTTEHTEEEINAKPPRRQDD
jgi:hypothetical protein